MIATREQIEEALHLYQQGDLRGALDALPAVPDKSEAELEVELDQAVAHPHSPAAGAGALESWVALARDRLRKELGEDVIAVVPVVLALNTALQFVAGGPARRRPKREDSRTLRLTLTLPAATAERLLSASDKQGLALAGFVAGLIEHEMALLA